MDNCEREVQALFQQVACPANCDELTETIRNAAASQQAIFPVGSGLRQSWGGAPTREGIGLSLQALAGIHDYQPHELTLTVEAGTKLGQLNQVLRAHGQWIPSIAFLPSELTVGSVLACPLPSTRDWRWGRFSDAVLGLDVTTGTGMRLSLGGRVVKNAAGYRLFRLFLGSWGTLGVISRATLLTRPRPESICSISVVMERASVVNTLSDVLAGQPLPCLSEVILLNARSAWSRYPALSERLSPRAVAACFLLEGDLPEVTSAAETLKTVADRHRWILVEGLNLADSEPAGEMIPNSGGVYHFAGTPGQLGLMMAYAEQVLPGVRLYGSWFSGILLALGAPEEVSPEAIVSLRGKLMTEGIGLSVLRRPAGTDWPREVLWGPAQPSHLYAQRWKDFCDPGNILNPGRYIFP